MNKEELVKEIADKTKLSQKATGEVIGTLLETIQKTVAKGKKVTLVGFGSFEASKPVQQLKFRQKRFPHFLQVKNSKTLLKNN